MSATAPTPGQSAYAAYCRVTYGEAAHPGDYHTLTWGQRDAWEAAAQAVLDAATPARGKGDDR